VVRILEERGEIDVSKPIDYYIPEINESDFAGISVRDVLDMATGLDCEDDYSNQYTCYYRYSASIGDGFRVADSADNPYDFLASLKGINRHAEPGHQYSYSGLNTFALAWLVEKVTGEPFQDVFTREIWYRIGAESNASYIAPRYGIAVTHGGFMARMRDVARFGLLFTPSYRVVTDDKVISDEHLDFILSGGRPELLINAGGPDASITGIKHNIYQWDRVYENGDIYKGGWAGQGLIINPSRDTVVVFTGYFKDDAGSEVEALPKIMQVMNGVFGDQRN
jgi:CubicO group peptidase (beta-lactamase class C family)